MRIQLVLAIEALSTEATLWMSLETALILSARNVIAKLLVLAKVLLSEKLMFVRENLLSARAKIAHDLVMHIPDMTVQIRPAQTRRIAVAIRAVVAQEQYSIFKDLRLLVGDA